MKLKTLVRIRELMDAEVEALIEARDDKYNELRTARYKLDSLTDERTEDSAIMAARLEVARLEDEYAGITADYTEADNALNDLLEHEWR